MTPNPQPTCPGCDKTIPWDVKSCPFCGRPLIYTKAWWPYLWLLLFLLALVIGAIWASTGPPTPVLNEEHKIILPVP